VAAGQLHLRRGHPGAAASGGPQALVLAYEVMLAPPRSKNNIKEMNLNGLNLAIHSGIEDGMKSPGHVPSRNLYPGGADHLRDGVGLRPGPEDAGAARPSAGFGAGLQGPGLRSLAPARRAVKDSRGGQAGDADLPRRHVDFDPAAGASRPDTARERVNGLVG